MEQALPKNIILHICSFISHEELYHNFLCLNKKTTLYILERYKEDREERLVNFFPIEKIEITENLVRTVCKYYSKKTIEEVLRKIPQEKQNLLLEGILGICSSSRNFNIINIFLEKVVKPFNYEKYILIPVLEEPDKIDVAKVKLIINYIDRCDKKYPRVKEENDICHLRNLPKSIEVFKIIISYYGEFDEDKEENNSLLSLCCSSDDDSVVDFVKYLYNEKGYRFYDDNQADETMQYLFEMNCVKIIDFFLEKGEKIDKYTANFIQEGNEHLVEKIVKNCPLKLVLETYITYGEFFSVFEELVKNAVEQEINLDDLLLKAFAEKNKDFMKILKNHGARSSKEMDDFISKNNKRKQI